MTSPARASTVKGIRIRTEKHGLSATLFDLEAEVMDLVWSRAWPTFTVPDVHRVLEARRRIAYTTTMTTVDRLYKKEHLDRTKEGRRYRYRPLMSRDEFNRALARDVFESLPEVGAEAALSLLVDRIADSDSEQLSRLEALIVAKRRTLVNE